MAAVYLEVPLITLERGQLYKCQNSLHFVVHFGLETQTHSSPNVLYNILHTVLKGYSAGRNVIILHLCIV